MTAWWRWAALLSLGLLVAASSSAPVSGPRRGAPCVFDTAAATLAVPATVYLRPSDDLKDSLARQDARRYIAALAPHFHAPARLEIGVRPILPISRLGEPAESLNFQLDGPLLLPLGADSRLGPGPAVASSGLADINAALVAAVVSRDSDGPLPVKAWAAEATSGPLQLSIGVSAADLPGTLPLMHARIPVFKADREVSPRQFAKPEYPFSSQRRGEGSRIDVRYVVGEDGSAVPGSIEVLLVTVDTDRPPSDVAKAFASASIKAIAASRFNPARVAGCPVSSTVRQRISFTIGS